LTSSTFEGTLTCYLTGYSGTWGATLGLNIWFPIYC